MKPFSKDFLLQNDRVKNLWEIAVEALQLSPHFEDPKIQAFFDRISILEKVDAGEPYLDQARKVLSLLPLDPKACAKLTAEDTAAMIRSMTQFTLTCFEHPAYGLHLPALHQLNKMLSVSLADLQKMDNASASKLRAVANDLAKAFSEDTRTNPAVEFELYHHLVPRSNNGARYLRAQDFLEPFYVAQIEAEPTECVDMPEPPHGWMERSKPVPPKPRFGFLTKLLGR